VSVKQRQKWRTERTQSRVPTSSSIFITTTDKNQRRWYNWNTPHQPELLNMLKASLARLQRANRKLTEGPLTRWTDDNKSFVELSMRSFHSPVEVKHISVQSTCWSASVMLLLLRPVVILCHSSWELSGKLCKTLSFAWLCRKRGSGYPEKLEIYPNSNLESGRAENCTPEST
jgi:hypothetical protein